MGRGPGFTLFCDASALVAIVVGEPERDALIERLQQESGDLLWSAMACWETASAIRRKRETTVTLARSEVEQAAFDIGLNLVPIGEEERRLALDAYEKFGRGNRHPAKLNMGDCFAYACAKTNGAQLLYKGNDFIHTDLR